eukprot:5069698-Prymnesium_polylepis.1
MAVPVARAGHGVRRRRGRWAARVPRKPVCRLPVAGFTFSRDDASREGMGSAGRLTWNRSNSSWVVGLPTRSSPSTHDRVRGVQWVRPRRTYRRARQRTARQLGPDRLKSHQAALLRPPHRAGTAQLRHEWHASHHAHRGHSPLRILSTNALPTPAVYMHMLESASVHGESHPRAQAAPPLTIATARGFPSSDGRSAPQATGGLRASGDGVRGVARPLRDHLGRALRGVLGKVLLEEGGEVVLRLLELGRVGPRTRRVEQR